MTPGRIFICFQFRAMGGPFRGKERASREESRAPPLRGARRAYRVSTAAHKRQRWYPETETDQKETKEAGVLPRLRRSFSAKRRLSLVASLLPVLCLRRRRRRCAPTLSPRTLACPRHFPPQKSDFGRLYLYYRSILYPWKEIFAQQITSFF